MMLLGAGFSWGDSVMSRAKIRSPALPSSFLLSSINSLVQIPDGFACSSVFENKEDEPAIETPIFSISDFEIALPLFVSTKSFTPTLMFS